MRRLVAFAVLAMLCAASVRADEAFGPPDDLFHFEGFEWLGQGALFCIDGACSKGRAVMLVADAAQGHLDVYIAGPGRSLGQPGTACAIAVHYYGGPVYRAGNAFLYPAEIAGQQTVRPGPAFTAVSLEGLTEARGAPIRFVTLKAADLQDTTLRPLLKAVDGGDLARLADPAWPAAWAALAARAAPKLAALRPDEAFSRLTLLRLTGPEERDALRARAIQGGEIARGAHTFAETDCLPGDTLAGVGK